MFNNFFSIDQDTDVIVGLNNELKCLYVYNRFIQKNESIVFLVDNLYEATTFYQMLLNYTDDVLLFPMDELYIYEVQAASPELKSTRLETIISILKDSKKIIVTNLTAYLKILPPKNLFQKKTIKLQKNQEINIEMLKEELLNLGYNREILVNKTGEMGFRGFVIDIFPINEEHPLRIEFWGDIIESIRIFDENTQKTIKEVNNIIINANTMFLSVEPTQKSDVNNEIYNYSCNILSYLDNPKLIINDINKIENSYKKICDELKFFSKNNSVKHLYPLTNVLYFSDFDYEIKDTKKRINYSVKNIEPFDQNPNLINDRLNKYILERKDVIICLNNNKLINKLMYELNNESMIITNEDVIFSNKINIIIKKITNGFIMNNIVVLSENDLFNTNLTNSKYTSKFRIGTKIRDLNKINKGDYIVHNKHGIGQYLGIEKIIQNGMAKDYIALRYRDNDKLYIPVEKIEVISKYSVNEGIIPRLSKLGGVEWSKTKLRVRNKIEDIALSLLKLYAERESTKGFAFIEDDINQLEFEKEFKFKDTTDQSRATIEIKNDMQKNYPMDRILCGDVGFGKTEVAFRAMFKAVMSGKQVAFLCPTTILSYQHYNNAIERFKSFAVNIVLLNRFVSPSQIRKSLEEIRSGKADIVIGTHRLLSNDVIFKDLGLLVIDEEQRFGVKHKEKVKLFKNNIDVLTLTATPIPRTLQMTFTGIRSLSLIETPPKNRYPIQTYVIHYNDLIIRDTVYKEKLRNGQVYILYNSVKDMDDKVHHFQKLMPDLRIISAHGQMNKQELEKIMFDFYNHKYDVLLCTTIIETGIDIPNVNTIIIIDADRFGLSQLYQIRGRVGRSDKIAYCYLMYDKHKILTEASQKRLKVIKEFTELGSGFSIATRDLSIRGAGDILGSEQAGFIDSVGIEMFLKMLDDEIKKLKGELVELQEDQDDTLPLISVETSISDDYVEDEELKIEIHKKINTIDSYERLINVKKEIEDRFGKINKKMLVYMYEEWFEKLARHLNITNVNQGKNFIEIELPDKITNQLNIQDLFYEVNKITNMFRFGFKKTKLIITLDTLKLDKHFIYYLVELLTLIEEKIAL